MRKLNYTCFLACASWLAPGTLLAQEPAWPTKPLRIIAAVSAGGVTDIRARWLAPRLAVALGQSVVVENKPGAGGNIGTEMAARSAPDGYTLVIIHPGTMAVNPHLYARAGYDPLVDFIPLTRIGGSGPLVLAVAADSPAKDLNDLLRMAREKPGRLSFGSSGIGGPPHMAAELLKRLAGIDAIHVPYKGGGQAANDLIAGHVNWVFDGTAVQFPLIKAGRTRALAVTGSARVAGLPDVPTMAEAGVPGYEFTVWSGIALPAGTPPPIVARLHAEISKILGSAEAREYFASLGFSAGADNMDAFAAQIRAEHAKWGDIIRQTGMKAE